MVALASAVFAILSGSRMRTESNSDCPGIGRGRRCSRGIGVRALGQLHDRGLHTTSSSDFRYDQRGAIDISHTNRLARRPWPHSLPESFRTETVCASWSGFGCSRASPDLPHGTAAGSAHCRAFWPCVLRRILADCISEEAQVRPAATLADLRTETTDGNGSGSSPSPISGAGIQGPRIAAAGRVPSLVTLFCANERMQGLARRSDAGEWHDPCNSRGFGVAGHNHRLHSPHVSVSLSCSHLTSRSF